MEAVGGSEVLFGMVLVGTGILRGTGSLEVEVGAAVDGDGSKICSDSDIIAEWRAMLNNYKILIYQPL